MLQIEGFGLKNFFSNSPFARLVTDESLLLPTCQLPHVFLLPLGLQAAVISLVYCRGER